MPRMSVPAICLLLALPLSVCAAKREADPLAQATHSSGFVDVWADAERGRVVIGIKQWQQPFLLVTSLPHGLGSNDIGLDRGQAGNVHEVEFRRLGPRVLLVERNTRYIASASAPAEQASVREAFAESVLWAGDVMPGSDSTLTRVDFSSFLTSDRHGIAERIDQAKQGKYSVDKDRSLPLLEHSRSFPDNTELEALLTLQGDGQGEFVRQVSMDPTALSVRQHVSLVRLPESGFAPRSYHPASGGFSQGIVDFSQPLAASLDVRWQPRFRLEKTDPTAALSTVKKPIVFYLDPGTPEPVRSALLEGANWWRQAFEQAGFKDAFRAELLPADVDPMDIRYNTILWVHRATRGWSYGSALTDPRTGEILKGNVTLGSQRVRQDILIAESLLAPYAQHAGQATPAAAQAMALARLRQLAAHEVGHALGLGHNFAASRNGNGSVLDYPHPLLRLDANGQLDLSQAYGIGVGPWDVFAIKHAYAQFAPDQEAEQLTALRRQAADAGLQYVGDADARAAGSAHPDGLLWDFGPQSLATFDQLLTIRRQALARFGVGVLPPARQLGELEARIVPIYLLHRYQTEAVARLLAGASYRYGLAGDTPAGTTPVDADTQRQALTKLTSLLDANELALPDSALDAMTPPGVEYERTREYLSTRMAPLFDPLSAASSAAALPLQYLLDPQRLNRLAWQYARDPQQPGVADMMNSVFQATWQRATAKESGKLAAVQLAINWTALDAVLGVLDAGQLHPQVEVQIRSRLQSWQEWLNSNTANATTADNRRQAAALITQYLKDPRSVKLRPLPTIPPGAPI